MKHRHPFDPDPAQYYGRSTAWLDRQLAYHAEQLRRETAKAQVRAQNSAAWHRAQMDCLLDVLEAREA